MKKYWKRTAVRAEFALIDLFDKLSDEEADALTNYIKALEAEIEAKYQAQYTWEEIWGNLIPLGMGMSFALFLIALTQIGNYVQ